MTKLMVVNAKGSPYECGKQYGDSVSNLIRKNVEIYSDLYFHVSGITKDEAIKYSLRYKSAIEEYCPSIIEEIQGISDGAGVSFGEIMMLNVRTELLALRNKAIRECTSISITTPLARPTDVWLAQNWDWLNITQGTAILYKVKQNRQPEHMMYVEAGQVGKLGLSEAGVGLCHNWLDSGVQKLGVPFIVLCRLILSQDTIKNAIDIVGKVKRASSGNFMIAHSSGFVVDLETSPDNIYILEPNNGLLIHTNHYISDKFCVEDRGLWSGGGDSLIRYQTAINKFCGVRNTINKNFIEKILKDRSCGDYSICTTPSPLEGKYDQWASLASVIMNVKKLEFYITHGNPLKNKYEKYNFRCI